MALISCPFCGKAVSDKAKVCPHCGNAVSVIEQQNKKTVFCAECGTPISDGALSCPSCGCPVEANNQAAYSPQPQKVEITAVNMPTVKKSAKKYVAVVVSVVIVALIGAVLAAIIHNANAQRAKEEYSQYLKEASSLMLVGSAQAENAGNLIKAVWSNTIFEKRDPETDQYTRSNGYGFNNDFNDSLSALFADSDFQSAISSIKENQQSVAELMKLLQNPPEEYAEAYQAIKTYYDVYLEFTNLVINPSGSLQTFSSNFNEADSNALRCYKAMEMYTN